MPTMHTHLMLDPPYSSINRCARASDCVAKPVVDSGLCSICSSAGASHAPRRFRHLFEAPANPSIFGKIFGDLYLDIPEFLGGYIGGGSEYRPKFLENLVVLY